MEQFSSICCVATLYHCPGQLYDNSNHSNVFAHLTNSSINTHSPDMDIDKPVIGRGCKWTLERLFEHLTATQGMDAEAVRSPSRTCPLGGRVRLCSWQLPADIFVCLIDCGVQVWQRIGDVVTLTLLSIVGRVIIFMIIWHLST